MNEPGFDLRDKPSRKLSTLPYISSEKRLKRTELRGVIGEETVRLCLDACGQGLRAIVLTGSLARDEATFVEEDSGWQLLGDADFFLVYEQSSRLPSDGDLASLISAIEDSLVARGIYGQIGLAAVHTSYLRRLKPRIATYELRTCGRVLWGDAGILSLIPSFDVGEISREDAWRMLCNRAIEFLGHAAETPPGEGESSSSFRYAAIKLILDTATSYLVFAGAYEPSFRRRAVRLCERARESAAIAAAPFSLKPFADQVSVCTAWKISGREKDSDFRPAIWKEAVRHACALWRWELIQLTGAPANLSDNALWARWVSRLTTPQTARGWLSLARRRGWSKSWRSWLRCVGLSRRGTPRYAMYRVAAGLLSRLSDSAEIDDAPLRLGSNWGELRALLPERAPTSVGREDSWQKLAADLSWNYKSFLLGTDA
jgi:hypothetical protein